MRSDRVVSGSRLRRSATGRDRRPATWSHRSGTESAQASIAGDRSSALAAFGSKWGPGRPRPTLRIRQRLRRIAEQGERVPSEALVLRRMLVGAIRLYQAGVSPLLPSACRFDPSCSEYARIAIERHGVGRGSWLAVRRIARCHPFGGFGPDPVPEAGHPEPELERIGP